jgi:cytochrome c-type biogenesis protein CcmH
MRRAALALLLACLAPLAFAIDTLQFKDAAEEARFQNLTRELRCLVCQNQNLADSDAGLAKDLRQEVFDQMHTGKTDAQIKDYLVSRYSDFVLYDPPLRAKTWLLWFGPFALLLLGGAVVGVIVRRRAKPAAELPTTPAGASVPGEEEDW